nr:hypothetical protein [uncultured Desulfuromonas sp.]
MKFFAIAFVVLSLTGCSVLKGKMPLEECRHGGNLMAAVVA